MKRLYSMCKTGKEEDSGMSACVRASVAMAVYNGERYLTEQINSIMRALSETDELVISDDGSTDGSVEIIQKFQMKYPNIVLCSNESDHGVCSNFTNAVQHCSGEYIFLSDQDDYWKENKIEYIVELFRNTGADMIIHDGEIGDQNLITKKETLFSESKITTNPFLNWYKGRFFGCCMAFRKSCCDYLMPFPKDVPHDIFASILAETLGKVVTVPDCLIIHRIHGENVTPKKRRQNLWVLFCDRMLLARRVISRIAQYKFGVVKKHN